MVTFCIIAKILLQPWHLCPSDNVSFISRPLTQNKISNKIDICPRILTPASALSMEKSIQNWTFSSPKARLNDIIAGQTQELIARSLNSKLTKTKQLTQRKPNIFFAIFQAESCCFSLQNCLTEVQSFKLKLLEVLSDCN